MGILQARILEWVAMPSSRGYSRPRNQTPASLTSPAFLDLLTGEISDAGKHWRQEEKGMTEDEMAG